MVKNRKFFILLVFLLLLGNYLLLNQNSDQDKDQFIKQGIAIDKENITPEPIKFALLGKSKPITVDKRLEKSNGSKGSQGLLKERKERKERKELKECFLRGNCTFSDEDPRARHFATVDRIKEELKYVKDKVNQDEGYHNWGSAIAREFFMLHSDHIKEISLSILSNIDPASSTLEVLIEGLKNSSNPQIYALALVELQKYSGSQDIAKITTFLNDVLLRGRFFASRKVAQNLLPLIKPSNIKVFQETLNKINKRSLKWKYLKNTIDEYHRIKNSS